MPAGSCGAYVPFGPNVGSVHPSLRVNIETSDLNHRKSGIDNRRPWSNGAAESWRSDAHIPDPPKSGCAAPVRRNDLSRPGQTILRLARWVRKARRILACRIVTVDMDLQGDEATRTPSGP
jgi:hypothetical protein